MLVTVVLTYHCVDDLSVMLMEHLYVAFTHCKVEQITTEKVVGVGSTLANLGVDRLASNNSCLDVGDFLDATVSDFLVEIVEPVDFDFINDSVVYDFAVGHVAVGATSGLDCASKHFMVDFVKAEDLMVID